MQTIDDYIDAAKAANHLQSDSALGRLLGFRANAVNHWRTKRTWPADETMVRLAQLAGMDPRQALLDLNIWRAHSGAAHKFYLEIAATFRASTLTLVAAAALSAGLVTLAGDASARRMPAHESGSVYIMENLRRLLRALLAPALIAC